MTWSKYVFFDFEILFLAAYKNLREVNDYIPAAVLYYLS